VRTLALLAVGALAVWLGLVLGGCFGMRCACPTPTPLEPTRYNIVDSTIAGFRDGVVEVRSGEVQVRYRTHDGPRYVVLTVDPRP
jgi:hypothetical protein